MTLPYILTSFYLENKKTHSKVWVGKLLWKRKMWY